MNTTQARIEWCGNVQVHHPVKPEPAPAEVVHALDSVPGIHTCTGCLWAVFTYSDQVHPAITADAVRRAFAKHLEALEAAA